MKFLRVILFFLMSSLLVGCAKKDKKLAEEQEEIRSALMIESALLPPIAETEWEKELNEGGNEENADKWSFSDSNDYEKVEWDLEQSLNLKVSLQGIICREQDTLVLDSENDQLLVIDDNGEVINTVGKTGNGQLEFERPTAITMTAESIYIIDGNNDRIQILNQDLTFKAELEIERRETNPDFVFKSIAVDRDGTIYLSGETEEKPGILFYRNNEKEGQWIPEYFNGYLKEYNGEVYGINSVQAYHADGDKNKIPVGSGTGRNYLLKIIGEKMNIERELPYGLGVLDFCFKDQNIVAISSVYQELTAISENDNVVQFLGSLEIDWLTGYISLDAKGNVYATDGSSGGVHVFRRKE